MSLSALIKKRERGTVATVPKEQPVLSVATATVATVATVALKTLPSVASVASVAVANPQTVQAANDTKGAVAAVPVGNETMLRIPNPDEAEQLRKLVQYVYQNDSEGDRNEALDAAMADVDAAIECYKAVVLERGLTPVIADDRRTCRQCSNLSYTGACSAAKPGGALSAVKGYRPGALWLENPHRCEAFEGKP